MPRILLVEDEAAIAATVAYALRAEGFEATHCLTGGEALDAARREPFDLAVLDVGLPDVGGFALCRELRRHRDLPVIFLTAHDAEADRILGLEIGADDYVTKPFSPRELVARVRLTQKQWDAMARMALDLFAAGQAHARQQGLILVDTKYEFGIDDKGKLWVIDEIHTADSSRYWIAQGSEERFLKGEDQKMLDKEFFRQWLIRERGYQGDGPLPEIPGEVRAQLAGKYLELVRTLTGETPKLEVGDTKTRIERNLKARKYL